MSGNTINGVQETVKRRPRQVFWARKPETLAQEWQLKRGAP